MRRVNKSELYNAPEPVVLTVVPDIVIVSVNVGDARVDELLRTLFPEPVEVVTPVPPFSTLSVPDSVTAPEVAVLGVRPVVPAENVVVAVAAAQAGVPELFVKIYPLTTPLVDGTTETDDHVGADPFEVSTVPFSPIASRVTAPEPVA